MLQENCRVLSHFELGAGYRFLELQAKGIVAASQPGQFVHLRVPALEASALRRPFSIFNAEGDKLTLLYKRVGRGTAALNELKAGDNVDVMGPLGHGFPTKCDGAALLVGGGFGVAPLYFLARCLKERSPELDISLFVGGRTQADLLALDHFAQLGIKTFLATNDGSAGETGMVTAPLDREIEMLRKAGERFELFACGPDSMLKAVSLRAVELGVKGWISIDRHMVCGVGACYACIQRTVRGNSRCCVEGPIFAAQDLVW